MNVARVRLPSGEAVIAFASIHLIEEKLQPFVDLALGEGAAVTDKFRFRDIGVQVAGSQQVGFSHHRCLAACKEMTRLVLLANFKSLRVLEDEGVLLPCVPGAGERAVPTPLSAPPDPGATSAAGVGTPLGNLVSGPTERAPTSQAGDRETTHEGPRDVASEPQRGAGTGWDQPERKRSRVDTVDYQAGDFRVLLDENSAQAPLPREVSTRGS